MTPELAHAIDTGDHVFHTPSNETWLVAYVEGKYLIPCGWPACFAKISDCVLTKKATPYERNNLLREMATPNGYEWNSDSRHLAAKRMLSSMNHAEP